MDTNIELGDLVRDRMTGFEGIVTSRAEWLNGCDRVGVQPTRLDKDGKPQEAQHFDVVQCSLVRVGGYPRKKKPATGGPKPNPPRH